MDEKNKNLKKKNLALLGLLVALVLILFSMALIKVDVNAAVNL